MNKPLILVEQEMKETLVNTINEYSKELPMSMILSALDSLVTSCTEIAEQQLASARKEYEKALAEESLAEEEANEEVMEEVVEENKEQTDE